MALTHEKRLERFIRAAAFGKNEAPIDRFVFSHAPAGGRAKQIWERKVDNGEILEPEVMPMVSEFMEILESDARGMGGLQRYIIEAFHDGTATPSGRFTAKIYGEDDEDEAHADALDTEGPTSKGMVAQAQRHVEALMKTFVGSMGVTMGTMQRMLAQQSEMNERLQRERFESLQVMEEAFTQRHERELEAMVVSSEQDRKDQLAEQIRALLPIAANRLLGKKLLPEKTTPREEMLRNIIHSMDEDQMRALQSVLRPDQQIGLFELLQAYSAEDEAKKRQASGKPTNGES